MNSRVAFIVAAVFAACSPVWFARHYAPIGVACLCIAAVWLVVGVVVRIREKR